MTGPSEDARRITWARTGGELALRSAKAIDLTYASRGDALLVMTLRADAVPASGEVSLGVDCADASACRTRLPLRAALAALPKGQWTTLAMPLKCFGDAGAAMGALRAPFVLESRVPLQLWLWQVRLDTHADTVLPCPSR